MFSIAAIPLTKSVPPLMVFSKQSNDLVQALGKIGQFLEQGIYFSIPASPSTDSHSYSTSSLLQRYEANMDQLTRLKEKEEPYCS
jgi:hypothetical protein